MTSGIEVLHKLYRALFQCWSHWDMIQQILWATPLKIWPGWLQTGTNGTLVLALFKFEAPKRLLGHLQRHSGSLDEAGCHRLCMSKAHKILPGNLEANCILGCALFSMMRPVVPSICGFLEMLKNHLKERKQCWYIILQAHALGIWTPEVNY